MMRGVYTGLAFKRSEKGANENECTSKSVHKLFTHLFIQYLAYAIRSSPCISSFLLIEDFLYMFQKSGHRDRHSEFPRRSGRQLAAESGRVFQLEKFLVSGRFCFAYTIMIAILSARCTACMCIGAREDN